MNMAHFQKHQYSSVPHTHEDGNPIYRTETTGDSGKRWFNTTMAADLQGHGGGQHDQGNRGVQLSGSSSSNSSSSEEIGSGVIRKKEKGMKDKIKMKPPGGIITTPGGYNVMREGRGQQQHHEKERMVEMIKEKFPEQSQ